MTHKERQMAVKEGRGAYRPAFAAWGPHMNLVDRNAKDFAEATIAYQDTYQFDFIKLMLKAPVLADSSIAKTTLMAS